MRLDVGGFEVAFAEDSHHVATVARDALVIVELGPQGWALKHRFPLGFDTATRVALCPRPFCYGWWMEQALFAENDVGYSISLKDGQIRRVSDVTEKVLMYMQLPGRSVAEVCLQPFETRIRRDNGRPERVLEGVLVCASPERGVWLVAPNPLAYPWGGVELALVDARDGRTLERFKAGAEAGRGVPGWQFRKAVFSPEGSLLATIETVSAIGLRDVRTGQVRQIIAEDRDIPGRPLGVAFSPDGCLVTASVPWGDDQSSGVLLWDRRR
jgi:hypothetical protein